MTKADLILAAKAIRKAFDAPLQSLKDFRKQAMEALKSDPQLEKEMECSGEVIAQATIGQRDAENAIMRLGMVLKNIGNPTPYPVSKITEADLAQSLYEAYCESTGWKSAVTGAALPAWADLAADESKAKVVAGWLAAARVHPALLRVEPTADGLKL